MSRNKWLKVLIGERTVGTLATVHNHLAAFEYDRDWLEDGFSISPFSLPLKKQVFLPKNYDPFEGLFGVFSDSLPDGWGRLLLDRLLRKNGIDPAAVDSMDRLAIVGMTGMGALTYEPQYRLDMQDLGLSLDQIAMECGKIFAEEQSEHLDTIFKLGGSSGGARPKIFYKLNGEEWIVKFPSSIDRPDIGRQEYQYSLCAKKCGILMPETLLLPSELNAGYFAVRRFDRKEGRRVHMVSVSGLLETSHRIPNLDYDILMQLTMRLTGDYQELEKLYRLMCFNVFAHNRDDHSKNFSYVYEQDRWRLSPAYDLTWSSSIGGEHATMINGNGRDPGMNDLLAVAEHAGIKRKLAGNIAMQVQEIVRTELGEYLQ